MKKFKDLTFCDNFMFQQVMQHKILCQRFLEALLGISISELIYVEPEKVIDNKYVSKGVRLDIYAKDDQGNTYDIEMQVSNNPKLELFKRARFYQGTMDGDALRKGARYTELQNSYVIFICPFDLFGKHRRVYSFKYYCREDKDIELRDGTNIIFLNSNGYGDEIPPEVADMLNLMEGKPVQTEYGKVLLAELAYRKTDEKVRENYMAFMNAVLDEVIVAEDRALNKGIKIGVDQGRKEGREEGRFDTVVLNIKNLMINMDLTAQKAMDVLCVPQVDRQAIMEALN